MRLITISLILLAACTEIAQAQSEMDRALLAIEEQVYASNNDSDFVELCLEKMDLYLSADEYSEAAFREARRIEYPLFRNTTDQKRYLWNAAIISQGIDELDIAGSYFSLYQHLYPDSAADASLLGLIIYSRSDSALFKKYLTRLIQVDARFMDLSCFLNLLNFERKGRGAFIGASAIVPGLGTMLNGNILKGFTSSIVNAGVIYSTVLLAQNNLYFNAVFWGGALGLKLYTGNLRLTGRSFDQKALKQRTSIADSCENSFRELLGAYPILPK